MFRLQDVDDDVSPDTKSTKMSPTFAGLSPLLDRGSLAKLFSSSV